MKETIKSTLLVALTPALLIAHAYTGNEGFYNVAAFLIVLFTLVLAIALAALAFFINHESFSFREAQLPEKPTIMLTISRILSVGITTYLVYTGHWIIATVSLISLGMSFVTWMLIDEARTRKEVDLHDLIKRKF